MTGPSFLDHLTFLRHRHKGHEVPWLKRHRGQSLESIPASALALHLPSSGGSGPGNLVIAPDGDAAFITSSGTCWELGPIPDSIDQIHERSDGGLDVFFSEPSSLHMAVEPDSARELTTLLNRRSPELSANRTETLEMEDAVGIFGKKRSSSPASPPLTLPGGHSLPPGVALNDYLIKSALSMTPQSPIPQEDMNSYIEASYAHVLGIPDQDQIIAWGPALIETPMDRRAHAGTVAVTRNTMLAFWQPGRTSMIHSFQANHSAAVSGEQTGPTATVITWQVAEYADNSGKFIVGDASLGLEAPLGRDGHSNRRALTWIYTLAALTGRGQ
jgi:hypothetical protein